MTHPTFLARFLTDGSTALQCRETGERYIVDFANGGRPAFDPDCGAYRNGQLIFIGSRAAAVNAVESDARWAIRNAS